MTLDAVGMAEINKIFAVTDALGVHREALVIPLGTGKGRVRKLPSGKFEITVDAVRHRVPSTVVPTPFFNPARKTAPIPRS